MKISFKMRTVFVPFVLVCVMICAAFTSCKGKRGLSGNTAGEITVMMWSGDNKYWPDIGSMNLTSDELLTQNVAGAYATAKAFKQIYPNIKINFFAKPGASEDDDGSWEQHRENFRAKYGAHPDMYATTDLVGDIQRGLIADLTIFKDDPMYKMFKPQIMAMMNIEGRQFGLPQYLLPWGVFINKSLADANNIDIPDPDWNIGEYTNFINHSKTNQFYGSYGGYSTDLAIINTGTRDFSYSLIHRKPGEPFVNINSDATRGLLKYAAQWRRNSIEANAELGLVSPEFIAEHWSSGRRFWTEGKLLTYTDDPWNIGDYAHPDPNHWGAVKAADWDVYPRPSTDYMPNTVGIVLDPLVIRNFAMDDGNPALSAAEEAKLRIVWEFAKFWCGDSRAWEARANQLFMDNNIIKSSLTSSFPMVTGEEFERQMEIWYIPEIHQRFKDKNRMPGFHYILDLWEKGQIWDVSNKAYPWFYDFEGSRRTIPGEWENAWDPGIVGAISTDPTWLDQVYARLPQWNAAMNQRWDNEMKKLEEALNRYYP